MLVISSYDAASGELLMRAKQRCTFVRAGMKVCLAPVRCFRHGLLLVLLMQLLVNLLHFNVSGCSVSPLGGGVPARTGAHCLYFVMHVMLFSTAGSPVASC
jgi:hypothetical protein